MPTLAVDKVSVGIGHGECFGLLGVNGEFGTHMYSCKCEPLLKSG